MAHHHHLHHHHPGLDPAHQGRASEPGHSHDQSRVENRRRLRIVLVLVVAYMVAEVVGAYFTNSLALLADAGHMLSDAAALALSLFAIWIADKPPTPGHTYGFYRTEILAALLNGAALVAIAAFIVIEAVKRFGAPEPVQGGLMIGVATGGLAINIAGLFLLEAGRADNLNMRGAWLHVLMDALGSVGAITAGALIWAFGWYWADPAASIAIALLVLYSSWGLLRETVAVLMESAPGHIDVDEVRQAIATTPGVGSTHDLHVWTITSGMVSLSAHVVGEPGVPQSVLLTELRARLRSRFGISHSTIQIEPAGFDDCAPDSHC